jgi:DNA-binding response OmpR family regulator
VVNLNARIVSVDDRVVHLSGKEYDLLELLSQHKGTVVTKELFLAHLYGGIKEPELKIIDVFVCHLRKKLVRATGGDHYIETVWVAAMCFETQSSPAGRSQPVRHEGIAHVGRSLLWAVDDAAAYNAAVAGCD